MIPHLIRSVDLGPFNVLSCVETILTILDEETKKHGREQYISTCPDLYHLMELESHTTQREETTLTTSHM